MAAENILIKQYSNRKFYNTATSKYTSLVEIFELIQGGAALTVVNASTGQDITNKTLMKILNEIQLESADLFDTKEIVNSLKMARGAVADIAASKAKDVKAVFDVEK